MGDDQQDGLPPGMIWSMEWRAIPERVNERIRPWMLAALIGLAMLLSLVLGRGNDAPATLQATAGVALGVNSDITAEAAGAVILQSSLQSVDELIHIGGRMRRIALQSAIGGMSLSIVGMLAAAFGYLAPIQGALMQEGIDLLSIFNSLRVVLPTGPLSDFSSAEAARAAPEGTPGFAH